MAYSEELAGRIRRRLVGLEGIEEKRLFGGLGFLLYGNLCVGVRGESLIVRVGPEQAAAALHEPSVTPFTVGGRAMAGWLLVGPEGIDDDSRLDDWLSRAGSYVSTLPAK